MSPSELANVTLIANSRRESYRAKYRSKAIIQGAVLRKILYSSPLVEIPSAAKASLYSMCLQTLPMYAGPFR